ncbi:acyl-CoA dehydrogenase family protein [Parafrankia sp. BMG5.11]|nr:acyl-CoA dehydrogenase family protein [Parafrankia sp. BMG5.11]TCJ33877.1 acyl-CoA dehydrogenase [Parafrankia sp. BMG5.11]SQD99123.1 Ccyl-CoA dehydrogenase type 2 domain protein [Parafrankia sp. Ea1.12]
MADPTARSATDPGLARPQPQPRPQPRLDLLPELTAQFAATAAEHDRTGTFPVANIRALHAAGLLSLTVPSRYGGAGAGLATVTEVLGAVARGEPATALVLAMNLLFHAHVGDPPGWPAGTYERVVASCLDEGALINALRVEPDLGTPARGGVPATTARWTGDGWEITGRKTYSTGAPVLRWMLVWAATDPATDPRPPSSGAARVGSFLVPADTPGITIVRTWDHLGMRATESHDVVFDRVRVGPDAAVGLPAGEVPLPFVPAAAAWNALAIASIYLGVAEAARDWLVGYLHERTPTNLGAPLSSLPRFQSAVGEIEVALANARGLVRAFAQRSDAADPDVAAQVNGVKTAVTAAAVKTVTDAVALIGNPGLTRANPLERHLRDVLCSRVHTPQDDVVYATAGRTALGLPAAGPR